MCATIWHSRDSEQEAWIREIATKHVASLEASLKDFVFYDERTDEEYKDEEYKYEPDAEIHQRLISLFTSFVERRMMSFGKGSEYTEPDVKVY